MEGKSLTARGLCKTYGKVRALDHVSLTLEPGHIYGLIGRNDSRSAASDGPSCRWTRGRWPTAARRCGENEAALADLCFRPGTDRQAGGPAPPACGVKDYLKAGRLFYPHWDEAYAQKLVRLFGLEEKKRLNALSKGMTSARHHRAGAGQPGARHDDGRARRRAGRSKRGRIFTACCWRITPGPGRTFVISTHILEEAAPVFERVMVMKEGRLIEKLRDRRFTGAVLRGIGPGRRGGRRLRGVRSAAHRSAGAVRCCVRCARRGKPSPPAGWMWTAPRFRLQKVFVAPVRHEREGLV